MKQHFDHLLENIPDLKDRKILDLGSGKGGFLIEATKHKAVIVGVEKFPAYIKEAGERAYSEGITLVMKEGVGEHIPHPDNEFGFVNMSEVIEHVENPDKTLDEVYRVLRPQGLVYMSVPNRFSFRDQHFDLYGVNWLPRSFAHTYISLFGKHKKYTEDAGHQQLKDMHYYTYRKIKQLCESKGFDVQDIRLLKIKKYSKLKSLIGLVSYKLLRPWYFDSFHLLLKKSN